jgi:hypothetical protein
MAACPPGSGIIGNHGADAMTDKTDFAFHVVDDAHNSNPQESEVSATIPAISVETDTRRIPRCGRSW